MLCCRVAFAPFGIGLYYFYYSNALVESICWMGCSGPVAEPTSRRLSKFWGKNIKTDEMGQESRKSVNLQFSI